MNHAVDREVADRIVQEVDAPTRRLSRTGRAQLAICLLKNATRVCRDFIAARNSMPLFRRNLSMKLDAKLLSCPSELGVKVRSPLLATKQFELCNSHGVTVTLGITAGH